MGSVGGKKRAAPFAGSAARQERPAAARVVSIRRAGLMRPPGKKVGAYAKKNKPFQRRDYDYTLPIEEGVRSIM
jgi:hypothetical protein